MTTKKVTEKSTKQELWDAYNEAALRTEAEPIELSLKETRQTTNEALKSLADSKFKVSEQLEKAAQEITNDLDSLGDLHNQIAKEKKQILDRLEEQKKVLNSEIESVKIKWNQDKKDHEVLLEEDSQAKIIERQRKEEEYEYKLALIRRTEENEYNENKAQKERELSERENILKTREAEILSMEKDLAGMPFKIETEVKNTQTLLTKDLNQRFETEKREFIFKAESEKKLAELKIANLESVCQNQIKENESLKKQLADVTTQLKQMAVSAIENRVGSSRSTASDSLSENK